MATIRDIARDAGVSTATVSRVLNDPGFGSMATRERILALVRERGFRQSALARGLVKNGMDALGIIVPNIENPIYPTIAKGAEAAAAARGLPLILCNSDGDPAKEQAYAQFLCTMRPAGVIVSGLRAAHVYTPVLQEGGIPVVSLDRSVEGVDCVLVDQAEAARLATRHLIGLGYRRIGFLTGKTDHPITQDRLSGFYEALREAGLPLYPQLVVESEFTLDSAQRGTEALLSLPEPPEALLVVSDVLALAAIRTAEQRGVRIPQDLAVVSFDDVMVASLAHPGLTTVRQPLYRSGEAAVETLLARITDPGRPAQRTVLTPELMVRETCGATLRRGEY
jgi:LacI family transcriptional regulator